MRYPSEEADFYKHEQLVGNEMQTSREATISNNYPYSVKLRTDND
jgi:hypothetical protein